MDISETLQPPTDLFAAVSDVVQTQGQMLSALMETQNRLLQCVVQRVAKNTERLDTVILKFEELFRRGGIDGGSPSNVHPFVTEPKPSVEQPKKTAEELTPPATDAEEEQPKKTVEELTPPATVAEEEQPKKTVEELTPPATDAEEEQPKKTVEELTPPATVAEEEQPKKTAEELTPPAPVAEEEQPTAGEAPAAPPLKRYDPNELLVVRGSSHLPPVNAKDPETFRELGIDKSQQPAAPPAIQDGKPPAVPVEDDWDTPAGAPSQHQPQQANTQYDDYSQHQQTWNNGGHSQQRGTGPRGGGAPRGGGGFGGGRGGAMPTARANQPSTNAPQSWNNNGSGPQTFGDQPSRAPGGNFAKAGDDFAANGHASGGGFGRGGGRGAAGPRGGAPYRGGGFGGTPRGGGPGGFNNAPQQRSNDAPSGFGAQPSFDKPQFGGGGGGFDGNENKLPNFRPTLNGPPAHSNFTNNGFNGGGDGGFNSPPQQQAAAPRDNGFQPPQQQQARPFVAAQQQPRGGGNFYNAASCRGGRGAFPRR